MNKLASELNDNDAELKGLRDVKDGDTDLLDVSFSLCTMASLGFSITAALWSIRLL
jgi:hypothetical protein